jgi:DNA-binding MarR family transcriptional regulator
MPYAAAIEKLTRINDIMRLEADDLSRSEAAVVLAIASCPGCSLVEVAGRLGLPQSTTSRLVAGLSGLREGKGLVESRQDMDERRKVRLTLSRKGHRLLTKLAAALAVLLLLFTASAPLHPVEVMVPTVDDELHDQLLQLDHFAA